jgi:hypothetical protein
MRALILLLAIVASPAFGEVKSQSSTSFELEWRAVVPATPNETFAQLGRIGDWWDVAHSYSRKAENLSLDLRAGGCFCEKTDDGGSIEHMRVVYVAPGTAVRMQGGLGPLQQEAVTGTFSWTLKPVPQGTEITQSYIVSGFIRSGADSFASPVDRVLGEQFARLVKKLGG